MKSVRANLSLLLGLKQNRQLTFPIDADVEVAERPAADEAAADERPIDEALQPVEIPEKVVIEDLEISATSSVQDLRRICRFFGINQSGSINVRCMREL